MEWQERYIDEHSDLEMELERLFAILGPEMSESDLEAVDEAVRICSLGFTVSKMKYELSSLATSRISLDDFRKAAAADESDINKARIFSLAELMPFEYAVKGMKLSLGCANVSHFYSIVRSVMYISDTFFPEGTEILFGYAALDENFRWDWLAHAYECRIPVEEGRKAGFSVRKYDDGIISQTPVFSMYELKSNDGTIMKEECYLSPEDEDDVLSILTNAPVKRRLRISSRCVNANVNVRYLRYVEVRFSICKAVFVEKVLDIDKRVMRADRKHESKGCSVYIFPDGKVFDSIEDDSGGHELSESGKKMLLKRYGAAAEDMFVRLAEATKNA